MVRADSRETIDHNWHVPSIPGYAFYFAGTLFFIDEFKRFSIQGYVRQSDVLAATFVITLFILLLGLLVFQFAKPTSLKVAALAIAIIMLSLLSLTFTFFASTELCFFAGSLIVICIEAYPKPASVYSAILVAVYTFPSLLTSVVGKNILLADNFPPTDSLSRAAGSLLLIIVAWGASIARTAARRSREAEAALRHLDTTVNQLSKINQDLQQYARTIDEEAISNERNRISREIHDISGYRFTNVAALMDAAVSMGGKEPEKIQELCLTARNQARDGLQETRRALKALRANTVHLKRGVPAIYKICSVFRKITGIKIDIESGNIPNSFGEQIDMAVFRLVQEALTNSMRHGRATAVKIFFWIIDGWLEVVVKDNGIGAQQVVKDIGLSGMEERLANLGGELEAGSVPEGGFSLKARIPLDGERKAQHG